MTVLRKDPRGFTLVELMIVVAIIGIISTLAIFGVARYLKHSKTAEATANLGSIENGSRVQFQAETPYGGVGTQSFAHEFCPTAAMVPATVPMAQRVTVSSALWTTVGWSCLKFTVDAPQNYAYAYTSNGGTATSAAYTADAYGDLDGNGTQSTFEISGVGGPLGDAVRVAFRIVNEDE